MNWTDQALADYGRALGIDSLEFSEQGVVNLAFERTGSLFIERIHDDLLVYLSREIDHPSAEVYALAFYLCHWRHNHPFGVNPALRHDRTLVFSVRLKEEDVNLPTLQQVIGLLGELHNQILDGATI